MRFGFAREFGAWVFKDARNTVTVDKVRMQGPSIKDFYGPVAK